MLEKLQELGRIDPNARFDSDSEEIFEPSQSNIGNRVSNKANLAVPSAGQPTGSSLTSLAKIPEEESEEERITEEKTKKRKKPVDPNAPKKPQNPFMQFCSAERAKMKQEATSKGISLTEVTRLLGQKWTSMEEADKKRNSFY